MSKIAGKLRILGFIDNLKLSGSKFHRIVLVSKHLQGKKILVEGEELEIQVDLLERANYDIEEQDLSSYDILWVHFSLATPPWKLSQMLEKTNCRLQVDADDYWLLPKGHIQYGANYSHLIHQFVLADYITVSTDRLAEHVKSLRGADLEGNYPVLVSYNHLPNDNQFKYANK